MAKETAPKDLKYEEVIEERVLEQLRRTRAQQLIEQALREELTATQLEAVATKQPEFEAQAARNREKASNYKKLSDDFLVEMDIDASQFDEELGQLLRNQLAQFESQYIEFREKLTYPEFYATSDMDKATLEAQLWVLECGIDAVRNFKLKK